MKNMIKMLTVALMLSTGVAHADDTPTGGTSELSVNIKGAILNVGAALSGGTSIAKQSVGSMLYGQFTGSIKSTTEVNGAILNVGAALSGGKSYACQSVGSIGSDCGKEGLSGGIL